MKKVLSIITVLIVCMVSKSWINAEATSGTDTTAPKVNSLTISEDEVSAPGTLMITASVEDDITGVKSVSIQFYNRETDSKIDVYLNLESSGQWGGAINIDKYANSGKYTLCYVLPKDNAGNSEYYAGDAFFYSNEHVNLPADLASVSFIVTDSVQN